jgi:hypothetical protein
VKSDFLIIVHRLAASDDDELIIVAGFSKLPNGIEKHGVPFPKAQHRDHAYDRWSPRFLQCWQAGFGAIWMKARHINAGGERCDVVTVQMEDFLKVIGDLLARGQNMVGKSGEGMSADARIGIAHINVAAADEQRCPRQPRRNAQQPSIPRAVRVHDLNPFAAKPQRQPYRVQRQQPAVKHTLPRSHARFSGSLENLTLRMRHQPHRAAAFLKTTQFGHHAMLLASPAAGGFGMEDAPGGAGGQGSARLQATVLAHACRKIKRK